MERRMWLRTPAGAPGWRNAYRSRCERHEDGSFAVMRKSVVVLLAIGLLQMLGDLLQVPALKAVAAATAASPAPTVFSSVRGLETFSTRFFIEWTDASRRFRSTEITP